MANPKTFTPVEHAAMDAVRFFAQQMGGAQDFADCFDLNRRTAYRLVGKQQPPPVGIAQKLLDAELKTNCHGQERATVEAALDHIAALRAFIAQRTISKGGR